MNIFPIIPINISVFLKGKKKKKLWSEGGLIVNKKLSFVVWKSGLCRTSQVGQLESLPTPNCV